MPALVQSLRQPLAARARSGLERLSSMTEDDLAVLPGTLPDHTLSISRDEVSVTIAEAARRLGCAASTVTALLRAGELSGHRASRAAKARGMLVHVSSIRAAKLRLGELGIF